MTAAAAVLMASCATLTKGTDQQVMVDTPGHPGAQCTLTSPAIGSRTVSTPSVINLQKSKHDIAVTCMSGCYRGASTIPSNFEGMTAGNILLGGVIGLGVDAASGAMNKYAPMATVTLLPDPNCQG